MVYMYMNTVCVQCSTLVVFVLQEKLNISCVHSSAIGELFRGIRAQMCNLITGKDVCC